MRVRSVLPVGLLLLSYTSLHGQRSLTPLSTETRTKLVPVATITIPAMSFYGDLGDVRISLGYSMVWMGGTYVELRALPGPGPTPAATLIGVSSQAPLPAGTYSVRWDFINVGFAAQLAIRTFKAEPLTTCSVNAWPGYNNVQSCSVMLTIADGQLLGVGITPTTFGAVMTLKQVTVVRYQ